LEEVGGSVGRVGCGRSHGADDDDGFAAVDSEVDWSGEFGITRYKLNTGVERDRLRNVWRKERPDWGFWQLVFVGDAMMR
jgi:hypothetical protein